MMSPISSNWFFYTMMSSMAKAMPSISQAGSSTSPLGGVGNDQSMFMMLLNAAMQGNQMNPVNPTNQKNSLPISSLSSNNQMLSQLGNQHTPPVSIPTAAAVEAPASTSTKTDLSFKPVQFIRLEDSLEGKLSGAATHFINAGKKYDLDPNLLSAIAIHETGNGSSRAAHEKNNVAGMMGRDGLRSYGSVEESIFDMARNLRQNYVDQGKTTIAEIGAKYAPVGAANDPTGLNNHWTKGVSRQLNNLA